MDCPERRQLFVIITDLLPGHQTSVGTSLTETRLDEPRALDEHTKRARQLRHRSKTLAYVRGEHSSWLSSIDGWNLRWETYSRTTLIQRRNRLQGCRGGHGRGDLQSQLPTPHRIPALLIVPLPVGAPTILCKPWLLHPAPRTIPSPPPPPPNYATSPTNTFPSWSRPTTTTTNIGVNTPSLSRPCP